MHVCARDYHKLTSLFLPLKMVAWQLHNLYIYVNTCSLLMWNKGQNWYTKSFSCVPAYTYGRSLYCIPNEAWVVVIIALWDFKLVKKWWGWQRRKWFWSLSDSVLLWCFHATRSLSAHENTPRWTVCCYVWNLAFLRDFLHYHILCVRAILKYI